MLYLAHKVHSAHYPLRRTCASFHIEADLYVSGRVTLLCINNLKIYVCCKF